MIADSEASNQLKNGSRIVLTGSRKFTMKIDPDRTKCKAFTKDLKLLKEMF